MELQRVRHDLGAEQQQDKRIGDLEASFMAQTVENLPAVQDVQVRSLGQEDRLEKGMATHSSILAWRTPWTVSSMGCDFPVRSAGSLQTWSHDIFI